MRWQVVFSVIGAICASQCFPTAADSTEMPDYICASNKDCKNYPGTVCITVESNDLPIKMCTPNTKQRPACLQGQYGMCPSYVELPDETTINAQCIFVADDSVVPEDRSRRRLQDSETAELETDEEAGSAEVEPDTAEGSGEEEPAPAPAPEPDTDGDLPSSSRKYAVYTISKKKVYGVFKCVDLAACEDYAADPSTCEPAACGSKGANKLCNNQGTCTHRSFQSIKQRGCMCYKGHSGSRCEKTESSLCDVTCGIGGDCVKGKCKCRDGFNGKKRDGRCSKCTDDEACLNGGTCDTQTGKCECKPGYEGTTCKDPQDACVTTDCGKGFCRVTGSGDNAKGVCYCEFCDPECKKCTSEDCAECPDAGASSVLPTLLVATVATMLITLL